MPKNKCGLTKEQREKFLHDHGFQRARQGKGSHEEWEHPELKLLARSHGITPPANLLSNVGQNPWETTLSGDPASGTWRAIVKHAEWCRKTVEQIKAGSEHDRERCEIARQFREAVNGFRKRKKALRRSLKTGQPVETPKTSETYQEIQWLKAKRNQISTHPL